MELDWKDQLAAAFNIDPDSVSHDEPQVDVPAAKQNLKIMLDKKNRHGKAVTLIVDFNGSDEELKALAKELKALCGAGGSARGGEILIQGDVREKVQKYMVSKGHKARII